MPKSFLVKNAAKTTQNRTIDERTTTKTYAGKQKISAPPFVFVHIPSKNQGQFCLIFSIKSGSIDWIV